MKSQALQSPKGLHPRQSAELDHLDRPGHTWVTDGHKVRKGIMEELEISGARHVLSPNTNHIKSHQITSSSFFGLLLQVHVLALPALSAHPIQLTSCSGLAVCSTHWERLGKAAGHGRLTVCSASRCSAGSLLKCPCACVSVCEIATGKSFQIESAKMFSRGPVVRPSTSPTRGLACDTDITVDAQCRTCFECLSSC